MNKINIKFEMHYGLPIGMVIAFGNIFSRNRFVNVCDIYMIRDTNVSKYYNFLKRYSKKFNEKIKISMGNGKYKDWNSDDNNQIHGS